ncbi:XRE family transcriptional regulator [Treponema denticola]|uniref:LexA family transcriptional regulator n=1 Tax=Treponema denticola TaxID=158 RepID=UPI0021F873B1|nr:XRE family transcriptional regulator [Treponema denticola]UYT08170.1 XRE family transcriptional regulator [Treponema denticola]
MNFSEILTNFRKSSGKSQKDFAESLGIPQTTWAGYELGKSEPKLGTLIALEKMGFDYKRAFNLATEDAGESVDEAKTKIGMVTKLPDKKPLEVAGRIVEAQSQEAKDGFIIPILDQKLSAGYGSDLPDNDSPTAYISVPRFLAKYGTNLAALYVEGDSMEPTLSRGDMIVCDSCGWSGEGIYAIQMEGSGFVKRLSRKPGKLVVISDNPIYMPYEVPFESEDIRIIGRVHGVLHGIG